MSDVFTTPKSKRIGAKPATSPVLTRFVHQEGFSENKINTETRYQSFQDLVINELCQDPYGEYLGFCRINENSLRKAEKVGRNIYIQFGAQTNVHASACNFVTDIVQNHNAAHPNMRISGKAGGRLFNNGDEFEPDFNIRPRGFPAALGPTVVGEIQYSIAFVTAPADVVIGCDRKAGRYLRDCPHISAFLCVDIQYEWPAHGYPRNVLYYFSLPDDHPESVLVQPRRVVNIGRRLNHAELHAMSTIYSNLVDAGGDANMFGNGFGGCGDCYPGADADH